MIVRSFICLLVAFGFGVPQTGAHEVHGSAATVTLQESKLEVLHTIPVATAQKIAQNLVAPEEFGHNEVLATVAKGWEVSAGKESCRLDKQAYRLVHADAELQLRYLFVCKSGASPQTLALPWLMSAPEDHFVTLTMVSDGKSKTVIFQRQPLVISLQE